MKKIKIENKSYILLTQQELETLLDETRATTHIDETPVQTLSKDDLSPTESRFITSLRENVRKDKKMIVRQIGMDGISVSVFRFHLSDIG